MARMISAREAAKIAGVSPRRIQRLAKDGRIPGTQFVSSVWLIPADFTIKAAKRQRPSKINYT